MKRVGVVFWPKTGKPASVGTRIYEAFQEYEDLLKVELLDFDELNDKRIRPLDCLVIGGGTVGGDNWHTANNTNHWGELFEKLEMSDFTRKRVALFGLGNQVLYPYNFVDGMAELYEEFLRHGARIFGKWSTEGYDFSDSKAVDGEYFVGLAIDEDEQSEETNQRISSWVDQVVGEFLK